MWSDAEHVGQRAGCSGYERECGSDLSGGTFALLFDASYWHTAMAVTSGLQRRLRSFGERLAVRTAAFALCMIGGMDGVPERVRFLRIRFLLRCFGMAEAKGAMRRLHGACILTAGVMQSALRRLRSLWMACCSGIP